MDKLGTIAEVFRMVWHRRAWVLLPPIVMLTLVGALVLFGQASPLAPLLYPLF